MTEPASVPLAFFICRHSLSEPWAFVRSSGAYAFAIAFLWSGRALWGRALARPPPALLPTLVS